MLNKNKYYNNLLNLVTINNSVVSLINVLGYIHLEKTYTKIPLESIIMFISIGLVFGFGATWSQYKCTLATLKERLKEPSSVAAKRTQISNLAIIITIAADAFLIGIFRDPFMALLNIVMLNTFTVSAYFTSKLMLDIEKRLQKIQIIPEAESEDMHYAIGFGDGSIIYTALASGFFLLLQLMESLVNGHFNIFRNASPFFKVLFVLLVIMFVLIGIILGYTHNIVRFREVINKTKKLSKIEQSHKNFTGSIFTMLSHHFTNTYLFYYLIMIFLLGLFIFPVFKLNRLNFIPLIGFVYGLTDVLLWRLYFKKKIIQLPGLRCVYE